MRIKREQLLSFLALLALTYLVVLSWPHRTSAANTCTTCFIDYVAGSDSNDGTTQTTGGGHGPWKHAPGMKGLTPAGASTGDACAANCLAQVPVAGDKYIMKGGVVWPSTTAPWAWPTNGTSTTSTYGCVGSGCIYVGNATGAGLAAWNSGTVTSITLARDLGGWNPASPPTISCSGGGGSGAAATPLIMPAAQNDPLVSGFIYHINLTAAGSGYTSAPSCTVSGGGGIATLKADIDRAIFDLGAKGGSPPDWPVGQFTAFPNTFRPGPQFGKNFVIFSGVEVRNILQQQRTGSTTQEPFVNIGNHSTGSNLYVHGRFVDCVPVGPCNVGQEFQDAAISPAAPYAEIVNGVFENGDAFFLGTTTSAANGICGNNVACTFGTMGVATGTQTNDLPVSIHGNKMYVSSWQVRIAGTNTAGDTTPSLVYNNELWLVLADINISAHINRRYSQLPINPANATTIISYNNVDHNHLAGAGNQQQCSGNETLYFFNEVIWGTGTSTPPYGIDTADVGGTGGCQVFFFNSTINNPTSGFQCWNSQNASAVTNITTQNLQCITGPSVLNPYFGGPYTNNTIKNQAGSSVVANVQAASVVQSAATATSQGYAQSNAYAPTLSSNDTVTFASGGTTANLTSLCVGALVPLCSDINGNPRPTSGGWEAGAYQFNTTGSPTVTFTPLSLSFGSVNVGSSSSTGCVLDSTCQITLQNTGTANLTITSISIAGTNPGDFSQSNNCPATVIPTGTCLINGTFTPTASGARSATISVVDNAAGSPQTVPLSGNGVAAPVVSFTPPGGLNFGNQTPGSTSPTLTETVTNTGNANLILAASNAVVISGAQTAFFAITANTCTNGLTIVPTGTCSITLTFSPTTSGVATAQINLSDNAAGSPQVAPLTGTGNQAAPAATMFAGMQFHGRIR